MVRRIALAALSSALLVIGPRDSFAQIITGSIAGAVQDSSGAAIVGASVIATEERTGVDREVSTNERGEFVVTGLQPGRYTVAVTSEGFKRLERPGVVLSAAERLSLGALVLELGALTQTVTVAAQAQAVQTQSAERAGVITNKQIDGLLIKGRNVMSLLSLLPGVVDLDEPEQLTQNWNIYAQGNRRNTNNVSVDGVTLNAIGNQFNSVVNVSMDAVAEVKVLMSNYQAEYGRLSGANIHMITKSGTKEFHGLASYFKRHEQFNANNFFNNAEGLPRPRYRFNTWNYQVGGPAYVPGKWNRDKSKAFFFWSQEFWPLTVPTALTRRTVPTMLERRGDFSQSIDQDNRIIPIRNPSTGQSFPNNAVPASMLDPNGLALLSAFPEPNFLDRGVSRGAFNYIFQDEQRTPQRTETLKLDYNFNENNRVFFNYTHRRSEQTGAFGVSGAATNFDQFRQSSVNQGRLYAGRYDKILTPTLINQTNVGFSRRPWNNTLAPDSLRANQRSTIGFRLGQFNPSLNPLDLIPQATFGGVPNAAAFQFDGRTPLTTTHDIFTLSNNTTWIKGSHTVKWGFYFDRIWADNQQGVPFSGQFDFGRNVNNPLDTNYAYSNAALGFFNSYTEPSARPYPRAIVSNIEWFVQDNWRVNSKLTLDYGMRFYLLPQSFITSDAMSGFEPAAFRTDQTATLIQPTRVGGARMGVDPLTGTMYRPNFIGAISPASPTTANGIVSPLSDPSVPRALMANPPLQLGPRVGFAYDPTGKGDTAVRGGFGMFYNRIAQGIVTYPLTQQPPIVESPIIFFGEMNNLLTSSGVLFPSNVLGLHRDAEVPMVMNYSLGVQQRIPFQSILDVSYVGSLGRHLLWQRNINSIPFGTNFRPESIDPTTNAPFIAAFLRPYTGYNDINFREAAGSSNYHSLQAQITRRFAQGLDFGVAYTWSKALDFNNDDAQGVSVLIPVRDWNYGPATFDITHVVKANFLWALPNLSTSNPVARGVLNGWQLSGIATFATGRPMDVGLSTTVAYDITGSPTDGARPLVVGDARLSSSDRTFNRWFDTAAFALPERGTFGNAGRGVLRAPGINNWDIAVFKDFPIREQVRMQFRWETYNTWNHTQFNAVDTAARFNPATGQQVNARFGQLIGARDARRMQFALRLYF